MSELGALTDESDENIVEAVAPVCLSNLNLPAGLILLQKRNLPQIAGCRHSAKQHVAHPSGDPRAASIRRFALDKIKGVVVSQPEFIDQASSDRAILAGKTGHSRWFRVSEVGVGRAAREGRQ